MKLKEKNFHNLKEVDKEFPAKLKTIDVSICFVVSVWLTTVAAIKAEDFL